MKKNLAKTFALILASVMALSACSSNATTDTPSTETTPATVSETPSASTTPSESPTVSETPSVTPGDSENEIKDLVYPRLASRELETFNILFSQSSSDHENLCNLTDTLLGVNNMGQLVPGVAKEWGSEDGGNTWTFKLREGVTWVDYQGNYKADCTAWDWASSLEWVLNFHKNESVSTSKPIEMIAGSGDYYEWTKGITEEEAFALNGLEGSKFLEMVGVEVVDDYTIVYTCPSPKPYLDSLMVNGAMFPICQQMVDELGVQGVKSMNNETMWYNGPYTMTSYIRGNEKVFTKNESYWNKDCSLFDTVTVKMVESNDVAFQLYAAGELDYVLLTESNVKTISGNPNHEFYDYMVPDIYGKYPYQFHFNFAKNNEDGTPDTNWNTAIANEAFRKAWYYGLNLTEYFKRSNAINPMACENNFYSMKGLVYTADGRDYTELVREELGLPQENGETPIRIDATKAAEYKAQAIEELTALGVTFPVSIDYYISGSNQTSLDTANILKQIFTDCLGDDFAVLNIKTYVSSARQEVYAPRFHSIAINGWGADYGDPQTYIGQETIGYDNAYYSANYSYINEAEENDATKALFDTYREFTALVEAADAITTDSEARYAAYAKAEAYLIDHVLILPCNRSVGWALSRIDNSSRMNAIYGSQNEKMINWKTNSNGYTTEEAAAIEAAKYAN